MLYFAYGSNMDWDQMKQRCPSARFESRALLADHALAFTHFSRGRQSWVADVLPSNGPSVWGVVYAIDDADMSLLDAAEGYQPGRIGNAYERSAVTVLQEGDGTEPLVVCIYTVATPARETNCRPTESYKRLLVRGAVHWQLPVVVGGRTEAPRRFTRTLPTHPWTTFPERDVLPTAARHAAENARVECRA